MARAGRLSAKCVVVAFLLAACGEREGNNAADTATSADTATLGAAGAAQLEAAARNIVAFLQGKVPFDSVALADTVTLYVAPEGGGGRSVYAREQLRDPASWRAVSGPKAVQAGVELREPAVWSALSAQRSFPLAPPATNTKLTVKPGRHFNCMEYQLASRYPDLARLPHVGTRLEPQSAGSCLQSWDLTLVFDFPDQPRLVAAVYDQWEW